MRSILLALAAALTFYLYTYEWQITVLMFCSSHFLLVRNWRRYRLLIIIDAVIVILALPMLLYTAHELSNPWYWETVHRIGFIATHTVGSEAILVLAQLALGVICLFLIRTRLSSAIAIFCIITGISIGIASISNVVSGKDLETAVHIGRFMAFWAVCVSCVVLDAVKPVWSTAIRTRLAVLGAVVLLLCILVPEVRMIALINPAARAAEDYAPVLAWLRANTPAGSVVMAPEGLSYYLPVETRDYALFQPDGGLYLMPDSEVAERYLASRLATTTNLSFIEADFREYAGAGNAVHAYKTYNRNIKICQLIHRSDCGVPAPSGQAYKGEAYFRDLFSTYQSIQTHPVAELQKFQVGYVIVPQGSIMPKALQAGLSLETTIGNYAVYRLPPS